MILIVIKIRDLNQADLNRPTLFIKDIKILNGKVKAGYWKAPYTPLIKSISTSSRIFFSAYFHDFNICRTYTFATHCIKRIWTAQESLIRFDIGRTLTLNIIFKSTYYYLCTFFIDIKWKWQLKITFIYKTLKSSFLGLQAGRFRTSPNHCQVSNLSLS